MNPAEVTYLGFKIVDWAQILGTLLTLISILVALSIAWESAKRRRSSKVNRDDSTQSFKKLTPDAPSSSTGHYTKVAVAGVVSYELGDGLHDKFSADALAQIADKASNIAQSAAGDLGVNSVGLVADISDGSTISDVIGAITG
jgi:hypothetical protein